MTTSAVRSPQPRRRAAPSSRNQQIYLDYQTTGCSQTDLAKAYKLTQCRISQILRRVRAWLTREGEAPAEPGQSSMFTSSFPGSRLGTHYPEAPASSDAASNPELESSNSDRQDLDRALHRNYIDFVCRQAIREFQIDRVTVTRKKGKRGDKPFNETTKRREPKSLQCLKIINQALKLLRAFNPEPKATATRRQQQSSGSFNPEPKATASSPNDPNSIDASSDQMRRKKVESWICTERSKRKRAPDGNIDIDCFEAEDLVSALIGEPHTGEALEKIANDIGKTLVPLGPASGQLSIGWGNASSEAAVLPSTTEPASPAVQDSQPHASDKTNPAPDPAPLLPPSPTPSVPSSPLVDPALATDAAGNRLPFAERLRLKRARISSTSAPSAASRQRHAPQPLTSPFALPKVLGAPIVPPDLQPLYDKVVHLRQRQFKGLPCMVFFTPEEESQLYRLPPIVLEES
jgi:hypothetical protein